MMPQIRFGGWILEGWKLYASQWQTWTLLMISYLFPIGGVYLIMQIVSYKIRPIPEGVNLLQFFLDTFTESMAISIFTSILLALVSAFFVGGLFRAAFKQLDQEPIDATEALSGVELYAQVLVTIVLTGAIALVAQLLCFFPVFIVNGLMMFTMPLVIRQGLSPQDALMKSFEMTKSQWPVFMLFAFVMQLFSLIGIFGCLVGILFTYPLYFTISAVAYRDCFESGEKVVSRLDELYSKSCKACGKLLDVRASFCDRCGASQV